MDLKVGSRYSHFNDLEAAIEKFSRDTNSVYTVYNSKLIQSENRNRPADKQYPECLKYKLVKFACKHYGALRSRSRGLRPNQSTFKTGCPAYIYAKAAGKELIVVKMITSHSHECDPDLVAFYPERRSLPNSDFQTEISASGERSLLKSVREDVLDLLSLSVDRIRIRNYVHQRTNRMLLSADISNLAKTAREQQRAVCEERATELLNRLKMLESKENLPKAKLAERFRRDGNYKNLKTRISIEQGPKEDSYSGEPDEHCYSVTTSKKRRIHTLGDNQQWTNQSIEEVVKSIIGPNQEGPVLVNLNRYDDVAVVEVSQIHGYHNQDTTNSEEVTLADVLRESTTFSKIKKSVKSERNLTEQEEDDVLSSMVKFEGSEENSLMDSAPPDYLLQQDSSIAEDKETEDEPDEVYEVYDDEAEIDDNLHTEEIQSSGEIKRESLLEAQIFKLKDERKMLKVKTEKLRLQVLSLNKSLEQQDLEKEKLKLEISLLKLQVDEKEYEKRRRHLI